MCGTECKQRSCLHRTRCRNHGRKLHPSTSCHVRTRRSEHGHENIWSHYARSLLQGRRRTQQRRHVRILQQSPRRIPRQRGHRRMVQPRSRSRSLEPQKRLFGNQVMELPDTSIPTDGTAILRTHHGRPLESRHQHDVQYRHRHRRRRKHTRRRIPTQLRSIVQ